MRILKQPVLTRFLATFPPGSPAREFLNQHLLNQHPQAKGFLGWILGVYHPVFLDYPVKSLPRYGYGKPPHPQLLEVIDRNRAEYAYFLKSLLAHAEQFALIPLHENASKPTEPFWANNHFSPLDAMALYSILCSNNPKRYIEIGSGNSTQFCRRAIDDQKLRTRITSIDPHPRAEIDVICDEVIRSPLEDVDPGIFSILEQGDILFVDCSHQVFMNSDATVVFLDILPNLKTGVFVHFHDIFLPFDYPEETKERGWSEQYLLAVYLLCGTIDIVLPNAFILADEELSGTLSPLLKNSRMRECRLDGVSFWIKAP
jgi:hypothetical protein